MAGKAPVGKRLEPRLQLAVQRRLASAPIIRRIIDAGCDRSCRGASIDFRVVEPQPFPRRSADLRAKHARIDRQMRIEALGVAGVPDDAEEPRIGPEFRETQHAHIQARRRIVADLAGGGGMVVGKRVTPEAIVAVQTDASGELGLGRSAGGQAHNDAESDSPQQPATADRSSRPRTGRTRNHNGVLFQASWRTRRFRPMRYAPARTEGGVPGRAPASR